MSPDPRIEIVGVIPAAGVATRLGLHGFSKEILPIGYRVSNDGKLTPELVIDGLLSKMNYAGITNIYIVTRQDKFDIPRNIG